MSLLFLDECERGALPDVLFGPPPSSLKSRLRHVECFATFKELCFVLGKRRAPWFGDAWGVFVAPGGLQSVRSLASFTLTSRGQRFNLSRASQQSDRLRLVPRNGWTKRPLRYQNKRQANPSPRDALDQRGRIMILRLGQASKAPGAAHGHCHNEVKRRRRSGCLQVRLFHFTHTFNQMQRDVTIVFATVL